MKRTIAIVTTIVIVMCALTSLITVQVINYQQPETYATVAVVDRLEDNDKVVCVDYNENVWVFEGIEDWQEGDIVALTMDTCHTVTIYDDEIVETRYCGSIRGLD